MELKGSTFYYVKDGGDLKICIFYKNNKIAELCENPEINFNYVFRSRELEKKLMIEVYGDVTKLIEIINEFGPITNFDKITFNDSVLVENLIIDGVGTSIDACLSKYGVIGNKEFDEMVCNITISMLYPEKELSKEVK